MTDAKWTPCVTEDENPLNAKCTDPEIVKSATSCDSTVPGQICPTTDQCRFWELVNSPEACLISSYVEQSINIGGAILNVHKLLGVHEQNSLQDVSGLGEAISGGDLPNFPAKNAFDAFITEWRSRQTGRDVTAYAYIGYDFGPIKLSNGRLRYGIDTFIKHDIASFRIKQGCEAVNRVTKVRVERSSDGDKWYGVAVVSLQDCDGLITVDFSKSVPSRYWRLRPVDFAGGNDDYWSVQAFQLVEHEATNISNIQDKIFMENRDRDYNENAIRMKCAYTPVDVVANSMKFGFMGEEQYVVEVSFSATVAKLGRPFVIGDIIQLPSETQYTPSLQPRLKYLEVVDVAWSTNGYTPTWVPTMQRLIAKQAYASQETQDVMGKLTKNVDSSGLWDNDSGENAKYQDMSDITQSVKAESNTNVPQEGADYANIPTLSDELIKFGDDHNINLRKFNRNRHPHGIDAMPPNGLPFTEGDEFPDKPKNGDYHRLSYTHVGKDIPVRLYRYSTVKKQWVFMEADHRFRLRHTNSILEEFKTGNSTGRAVPTNKIDEALDGKI
jgi:hypothetical protein